MSSFTRKAEADWKGNLDQGHGLVSTESGALKQQEFSFKKRITQGDHSATNPEELIAAAAASCFSMALSKTVQDAGATPDLLHVTAGVSADLSTAGIKITTLHLQIDGTIPGFTKEQLDEAVAKTQKGCPIYLLLEPGFESIEVTTSLKN